MIIVTSTRSPNPRIRAFCNDLAASLPGGLRINRGKKSLKELALKAYQLKASTVIIVGASKGGNPGRMTFLKVYKGKYFFYPMILSLVGVKLTREMEECSRPNKVKGAIVTTLNIYSEEVKEFANNLADAMELYYVEIDAFSEISKFRSPFNVVIFVEEAYGRVKSVIKFFNPLNLKPSGPKLMVDKVVYRAISIER